MVYILAAIGAITLVVLLWQGFGPIRETLEKHTEQPQRPTAPDDDPDFLRRISEQQRKPRDEN
ncbi:hypothetical protein J2S53_002752 [Actinopolyspora lacussalsi]|uniref:Uncharacterized protein n=1 Tax=Actinopolyspora righensis TaxID=995060 RepID=A0A1I6ZCP8_9ACTN|nr:hypothetical protein [Actinopolyspora righensis]MDP9642807.1 hypothetical protein [Actinopolyspora lacussalsi]SFT60271.1 hypothetical protein SAMN04487904_104200 [Actinopolyspora righensis]